MTIFGLGKLAPGVSAYVLMHFFGKLGFQEVAAIIDDAFADHLRAF